MTLFLIVTTVVALAGVEAVASQVPISSVTPTENEQRSVCQLHP